MKFCKYNEGQMVANSDGSKQIKVVAQSFLPLAKVKDFAIGGALILAGVSYISYKAFCNGALCFEAAEYDALSKLGCINN